MQFSRPDYFREPHRLDFFERNGAGPPTQDLTRSRLKLVLAGTILTHLCTPQQPLHSDPPPEFPPLLCFSWHTSADLDVFVRIQLMIKVERCWLHPAPSHLHHVSTLMYQYMFCPNLCTRLQTHAASHCGPAISTPSCLLGLTPRALTRPSRTMGETVASVIYMGCSDSNLALANRNNRLNYSWSIAQGLLVLLWRRLWSMHPSSSYL